MAVKNQYYPQTRPHPGETLKEKLEEMGMGPKEFAIRTGKPEKTITAVLGGDSSITTDMAVQFENVTKIPAGFWINHQKNHDEYLAREKEKKTIEAAVEWARLFPATAMANYGWIPKRTTAKERAKELLAFFGFANHKAWEEYYFKQQLKVAFRISLASTRHPYAISAWLRMGEHQAATIKVKPYSDKAFKHALHKIRPLMTSCPPDFFNQLQFICAEAGVKIVFTPSLPKASLNGAARWFHDTPLIQLTDIYKPNEIFWFTFFHEAGHILKHGKKDIFLEDIDYNDRDLKKEREADEFAAEWVVSSASRSVQ